MAKTFLAGINLAGSELQNARAQHLATAPTPLTGLFYYDTATNQFRGYTSSGWVNWGAGEVTTTAMNTAIATAISNLVDSSPATLNTLHELATALGDDPVFATTMATSLGNKVDKNGAKQLSTEDFTTVLKTKLDGIAASANNYTHPANHAPSIIAQDATNRFVTDTQISTWNGKVGKYAVDIGTGALTSILVTHNLGTRDVAVSIHSNTTPWEEVETDVQKTSTNTITLLFATAPTTAQYRVTVVG